MSAMNNRSSRGFANVLSGAAFGQLITLAASPILTRIYQPDAFALLTIVSAWSAVLFAAFSLRLEMVATSMRDDQEAQTLIASALTACLLITTISTTALAAAGLLFSSWSNTANLAIWFWAIPLGTGGLAMFMTLNQWAVRTEDYASIGRRSALRGIATVAIQVCAGTAGMRTGGAALGFALGHVAGALSLALSPRGPRPLLTSVRQAWITTRKHWRAAAAISCSTLVNAAGSQAPILILAYLFAAPDIGQLGLTQRVMAAPVSLLGTSLSQVFMGQFSHALRTGLPALHLIPRITLRLIPVALVGASIITLWGPDLFSLIFGPEWRPAGNLARALAIMTGLQLLAAPASQAMILAGRARLQVTWDIARASIVSGAVLLCGAIGLSFSSTVLVFSVCGAVAYSVQWAINYWVVRNRDMNLAEGCVA